MNFDSNNIHLEWIFNASQSSSSQLGREFVKNNEKNFLNNSGINKGHSPGNTFNKSKRVEASSGMRWDMCPKGSPRKVTGKRGLTPDAIIAPVRPPKKRRMDVARGLQPKSAIHSNGLWHTKQGPRILDLLPIQYDSWFFLPEMWEYCGPDGKPNKTEQWSPSQNGDHKSTYESDRLNQDDDRENATAATVATWIELNCLRARYQQLVAEFHGGPLVVHHLADKESEEKLVAIAQASVSLEKAMAGVGRAVPPHSRLSSATAPAPALEQITRPIGATAGQIMTELYVAPPDTLLSVTPVEEVVLAQEPTSALAIATLLATLEASPAPPSSYESLENAAPSPAPAPPNVLEQEAPIAAPSNSSSSTKAGKRTQKATRNPQSTKAPSKPSMELSYVSPTGQFRFVAAGETRLKLLCAQEKYDEAYAMLPVEQEFEHLTAADAIANFRSVHPRPNKGGKGKQKVESELWVCKAKVKIERKELPKVNKGGATLDELSIVYSDVPCNGTATTRCSMIRHKKRTHLGRLYECNATE